MVALIPNSFLSQPTFQIYCFTNKTLGRKKFSIFPNLTYSWILLNPRPSCNTKLKFNECFYNILTAQYNQAWIVWWVFAEDFVPFSDLVLERIQPWSASKYVFDCSQFSYLFLYSELSVMQIKLKKKRLFRPTSDSVLDDVLFLGLYDNIFLLFLFFSLLVLHLVYNFISVYSFADNLIFCL